MFGISRYKKKTEPATAPASVPAPATTQVVNEEPKVKANVTRETNNQLSDTRRTLDDITDRLKRMKDKNSDFEEKFKKVTAINSDAMEQRRAGNTGDYDNILTELLGIEEGMFLMREDRNTYWGLIDQYIASFESKSSISTVKTGAHRLNKYAIDYIEGYQDALERGWKLKAKMCHKMIDYILTKGYQRENISDPEYRERRMKHKEHIVNEEGEDLIRQVDTIYGCLYSHDTMHSNCVDLQNKYCDTREKLGKIPDEIAKRIDSMGFKQAAKLLPVTSPERRIYLPVLMRLSHLDASIKNLLIQMENKNTEIVTHYSDFERVFADLEEQMTVSGDIMSQEEYDKKMNEFNSRIQSKISEMKQNSKQNEEREERFTAMINSFEDIPDSKATNYLRVVNKNDNALRNLKSETLDFKKASEEYKKELEEKPLLHNIGDPVMSEEPEKQPQYNDQG